MVTQSFLIRCWNQKSSHHAFPPPCRLQFQILFITLLGLAVLMDINRHKRWIKQGSAAGCIVGNPHAALTPNRWTSRWTRSVPSWTRSPTSETCQWLPTWIMGSPPWRTPWFPRLGLSLQPGPGRPASQTRARMSRSAASPLNQRTCPRASWWCTRSSVLNPF